MTFARTAFSGFACLSLAALMAGCSHHTPIATVNGESISRQEFDAMLDRSPQAQQLLRNMIHNKLIEQEAQREGVQPSQDTLQSILDELESDPRFAQDLQTSGMTPQEYEKVNLIPVVDQVMVQEKAAGLTDADLQNYLKLHGPMLAQPARLWAQVLDLPDRNSAERALTLLKTARFEVVATMVPAAPSPFGGPPPDPATIQLVPQQPLLGQPSLYPQAVVDALYKTPAGGITGIIEAAPSIPQQPGSTAPPPKLPIHFYVAKVVKKAPARDASLSIPSVRLQVIQQASAEKLSTDPKKLSSYQKMLTDLQKSAQVSVVAPGLKSVETSIHEPGAGVPGAPG